MTRFLWHACAIILLAGTLGAQPQPLAPIAPPTRAAADWTTFETEHFLVHARREFGPWARTVAVRMESIHQAVVGAVGYTPPGRITILVDDPLNTPNGNAISWLDAPQIALYPVPADPRSQVGRSRDWGDLLAVHEFAHVAHLTRPGRGGRAWLRWFPGQTGPLAGSPRWVKEGYATVIEGRLTGNGRPASPLRAAVLREWAVSGLLPTYASLNSTSGFEAGSFAYLMGSAFLERLEAEHGDSSLTALWRRATGKRARSFSQAFEESFGDTPADVYARYTAELTANAIALERALDSAGRVEGRLEARISRGGGDPAISPLGEFVALAIPGPVGEPGRVVVWSTDTTSDAERDSVQRVRAERLARSDPDDLLPVPQIPRGRTARYTLRDVNSASFREPRWFGDGQRMLVIRSDYQPDGSVRPDVFEWTLETGNVRRITHGAAISDADVLPGDTLAVGTRCLAGHCDIVRIDLRSGDVRTVIAGDAFTQYVRPRAMPNITRTAATELTRGVSSTTIARALPNATSAALPDGPLAVASSQVRGVWRPVLVQVLTGTTVPIGADVAWDRYDVTPTSSGDAVLLTSEQSGVPQLVRHTLSTGREVQLSRVFGAAMAPSPFPGDTSLLYLSLHARGHELRRLSVRDSGVTELPPTLLARFANPGVGAVVRQPPRDQGVLFDTLAPRRERAYGRGTPRWHLFPMGAGSQDGQGFGGAVGASDAVGRFGWMLLGMGSSDGTAERGGALRATLRTPLASFSGELVRASLGVASEQALRDRDFARDISASAPVSGEYLQSSTTAWSGAMLSAEWSRSDLRGHTGLRVGAAAHEVRGRAEIDVVTVVNTSVVMTTATQVVNRRASDTRWHGFVELQRTLSANLGPFDVRADVRAHVSRTHNALPSSLYMSGANIDVLTDPLNSTNAAVAVTRQLLQSRLALNAGGPLSLTYDALVGTMSGEAPMELFRVGGLPSQLVSSAATPQRIPAPWLAAGTLFGRDVTSHSLRWRAVSGLAPFLSAVKSGGPWLRTAGITADLAELAQPFYRLPGISAHTGIGYVFDVPSGSAVRAWAGVTFTP